jgi:hypothetical protein
MPPRHPRRDSGFVQSRPNGLFPGNSSYGKMPFPDSKSTAWDFFTDDCTIADATALPNSARPRAD